MAATTTDRIRLLLELGATDQSGAWPDYLQYGFTEADILALLDLVADEILDQAYSESSEVWAPLHARHTLGQLGNSQAAIPLLNQLDRLCEDDWARPELSIVTGMLGEPAIEQQATFLNDPRNMEFARVMALDGLAEIARHQPDCRERIIQCYSDYMSTPDDSATEDGFTRLESMSEAEVMEQQGQIELTVRRLFRHFLAQRRQAAVPYAREGKKTGRNGPCPCGSGKKYKHCCLH